MDFQGNVFEPQDMGFYNILYRIRSSTGLGQLISTTDVESMIANGADYIEEVKPKRWRAEYDREYWFVGDAFQVHKAFEFCNIYDDTRYEAGNYFQTKEQAEVVAKKIKALLQEEQNKLSGEMK